MTTFTIELETNNIISHATKQEAKAVPNAERFSSAEELAALAADWPTARLIEIWNGIPGATQVRKFTDRRAAATRIWKAIQPLGESIPAETATEAQPSTDEAPELGAAPAPAPEPEPIQDQPEPDVADQQPAPASEDVKPEPVANQVEADFGAQSPDVAAAEKATKKASSKTKTPTGDTAPNAPREASKTSQVIAMLRREGGVSLEEIMSSMAWQKHTARAMMSLGGSLTKGRGLIVTSEKVGDKRIYSIRA